MLFQTFKLQGLLISLLLYYLSPVSVCYSATLLVIPGNHPPNTAILLFQAMQDLNSESVREWDPSQTVTTAWSSTAQQRSNKVRRTYGRRGSNDYASSSVLLRQRIELSASKELPEEPDTSFTSFSSDSVHLDSSSTEDKFLADSYGPPPIRREVPPGRPSKKLHKRSTSLNLLPPPIPKPSLLRRASTIQAAQAETEPTMVFHRSASLSTFSSHRSSTSSSSHSSSYSENIHPNFLSCNIDSLSARKRFRARRSSMTNSILRGKGLSSSHRRASMSNIGNSPSSSNLRSDIAISGTVGGDLGSSSSCWMNSISRQASLSPPKLTFEGLDIGGGEDSSPSARSVATSVGSSRKRGMMEEPSDHDAEDLFASSADNGSFSVPRTSYASNKATSAANRLFSTEDMSMNTGPLFANVDLQYGDNAYERKGRVLDMSDEEGAEYFTEADEYEDSSANESMSEEDSDNVDDDASESSSINDGNGLSAVERVTTEEGVLSSMPSYEDLKHLTRELRKTQKNEAKTFILGTSMLFSVTLPSTWPPERRSAFIGWSIKLGFSVQTAGQSTSSLKMPKSQGVNCLKLLESAITLKKTNDQNGIKPSASSAPCKPSESASNTNVVDELQIQHSRPQSNAATKPFARLPSESTDDMLIDGMNALCFNEKDKDSSSLIRHVTLDEQDSVARLDRNNLDTSPRMGPSRPSIDSRCSSYFGADQDFMVHLHDFSPASLKPSRPPKMSLCSATSTVSNPRHEEKTPCRAGLTNQTNAQLTFDFVETPLMKQPGQGWGSRPVQGKDWGASEKCADHTIGLLVEQTNAELRKAGKDAQQIDLDSPHLYARSANLCLDLEADRSEGCDDGSDDEQADCFFPMADKKALGSTVESSPSSEGLRDMKRRSIAIAKRRRMSVCVSSHRPTVLPQRKPLFQYNKRQSVFGELAQREFFKRDVGVQEPLAAEQPLIEVLAEENLLQSVFAFLEGKDLLMTASLVCTSWAEAATDAYAELVLASVGCQEDNSKDEDDEDDIDEENDYYDEYQPMNSIALSMQRSWKYLLTTFPYASFLSEGSFKKVYKVKNAVVNDVEAVSVMYVLTHWLPFAL